MSTRLPLKYLGEPIIDAGLSAILIMSGKRYPEELTYADWENCLTNIKDYYIQNVLKSSIDIAFTLNGYNNPSRKDRGKKIEEVFSIAIYGKKERILSNKPDPVPPDGELCAFYENEEADIYVARDRFPLLPERDNLNLTPNGEGYLAVSRWVLGCVLASIFVSPKIDKGLLYISTYDKDMLFEMHKILYEKYILRQISIYKSGGDVNSFKVKHVPSRIYEIIDEVIAEREEDKLLYPIICYHISNYGEEPFAHIYRFPSNLVIFLKRVNTAKYKNSWQNFINNFYESKVKNNDLSEQKQNETVRNFYDYMLENRVYNYMVGNRTYDTMKFVGGFIKKFFFEYCLSKAKNYMKDEDKYKEESDYEPIWDLLILFIKTLFRGKPIIDMERQLDVIRSFATKLADVIEKYNDQKFYKDILGKGSIDVNNYHQFLNFLVKTLSNNLESRNELLFGSDDFVSLFIKSVKKYTMNWRIVRYVLSIALMEELFKRGYFIKNKKENSDLQYDKYDVNEI